MNKKQTCTFEWLPDRSSKIPIYRQIIHFISAQIQSGAWEVGTQLPSQRDLAAKLGVNRSTITTVMDELAADGIIESNFKGGTRIISNTWALLLSENSIWNRYVNLGSFKSNHAMIQAINRLEFTPSILRLGTGELDPALFPSELWKKAVKPLENIPSLNYLEASGLYQLRCAIVRYVTKFGIMATPDQVLITSGSLQALQLISVCILSADSVVYTEAPTYLKSLQIFQSAGITLESIPMDEEGILHHRLPRTDQRTRILYTIPTNHNPTGITMSNQRRKALFEYCGVNRIPIIEDGAYEELYFDKQHHQPIKQMDLNGDIIYLGTVSKTLSPGLRIGWVIASEPIIDRLGDVKMQMDYGASSVSQWIMTEFLNSGMYEQHLEQIRTEMEKRRDHGVRVLRQYLGDRVSFKSPAGGFYIWMRFNKKIPMQKLFEEAVKVGVLLNPGDIYDYAPTNALRISYSYLSCGEFEEAVKRLAGITKRWFEV
ncbi:PLP-dependent aminotransferase family protein [Acetobacterium carbinolicum]|uniref:aminotransferase-like domain-containing protein n=1 Tax=Acetobacterium carbinolicum TaxID=52690 RepID=UPI0039C94566